MRHILNDVDFQPFLSMLEHLLFYCSLLGRIPTTELPRLAISRTKVNTAQSCFLGQVSHTLLL